MSIYLSICEEALLRKILRNSFSGKAVLDIGSGNGDIALIFHGKDTRIIISLDIDLDVPVELLPQMRN